MIAPGHERAYTTQAPSFRLGRKAIKRDRAPNFCLWLQAVGQRIAHYVGLTPSSGHVDADFLLLKVQRTHADEPWTAANDPKRTSTSEP